MSTYNVTFWVDNTAPYVFEDIGLTPYVLSMKVSCGGKLSPFWQTDGKASLELDNSTGVFDVHDTSSLFYQKLLTKRRVRIYLNGEIFWTGVIEQLIPSLNSKQPTITLTLTQGLQNLKDRRLKGRVYEGLNGVELVNALLTDNPYLPNSLNTVFILDFSELDNDNLTEDYLAVVHNELGTDITYEYASDTWDGDTTLYKALEEVLQTEQSFALLDRLGELHLLPYYYVKIGTSAGVENIDTKAVDAEFVANPEIVNHAIVNYYLRAVNTGVEVVNEVRSIKTGEDIKFRVTALDTEQKRVILSDVVIITGENNFNVISFDGRGVVVRATNTLEDTPIVITARVLTIEKQSNVQVENSPSLELYRYRYTKTLDYKLLSSPTMAGVVGARALSRKAQPFTYIESMSFVDYYPYMVGDIVTLNSSKLSSGGNKHLILGEEHTLNNDTMSTTYYMVGSDSAKVFVLDESVLDGSDLLL